MWGPFAAAAAMQFIGNSMTNETNKDIAETTNVANAQEAAKNRDFQAEQADINRRFQKDYRLETYPDMVRSLKEAGLNPMLAYHQGSVSGSTSGSMPSGSQAQMQGYNALNVINGAAQTAAQLAQIRKTDAEIENINADTYNKKGIPKMQEAQIDQLKASASHLAEQAGLSMQQQRLVDRQVDNAIAENDLIKANTGNKDADTVLIKLRSKQLEMDIPRWEAERKFWKSSSGLLAPYTQHSGSGLMGTFQQLRGLLGLRITHGRGFLNDGRGANSANQVEEFLK